MEQTAVDWLFKKLWDTPIDKLTWQSFLEQAKEMEKNQIIDAHYYGQIHFENINWFTKHEGPMADDSITYYNQNYKQ